MNFSKIITVYIILILGAKIASNISFFTLLKAEIYKEMREVISRKTYKEEDVVIFNQQDLKKAAWHKSDEFVLDGNAYDVIDTTIKNGTQTWYCLKDHKEITLNKVQTIASALNIGKGKNDIFARSKTNNSVVKNFSGIISTSHCGFTPKLSTTYCANFHPLVKVNYFSKVFLPPPEIFSV